MAFFQLPTSISQLQKNYPRTRRRTLAQNGHEAAGSGQALPQHT